MVGNQHTISDLPCPLSLLLAEPFLAFSTAILVDTTTQIDTSILNQHANLNLDVTKILVLFDFIAHVTIPSRAKEFILTVYCPNTPGPSFRICIFQSHPFSETPQKNYDPAIQCEKTSSLFNILCP